MNIKKRWRCHKLDLKLNRHHCKHLQNAYNKYGLNAFEFNIVQNVDPIREDLLAAEQKWMDNSLNLYNTCKIAGSAQGIKLTKEQRAAISRGNKGKKRTPEQNEANRQAQIARVRTPEEIERWATNRRGSTQTIEHVAKRAASQRASKALRTSEQKAMSRLKSVETRGCQITLDGVQYLSYADAEQKLGISQYRLKKYGLP